MARRRHERRGPRQVGRRRARVARAPAVLVEVLGAAHRVAPLDAALRHAVLALQLGAAAARRLAPPQRGRAAVHALRAQHAPALGRAAQRRRALQLGAGAVVWRGRRGARAPVERDAVALGVERRLLGGRGRGGLGVPAAVFLLGVVGVVARVPPRARPGALGLVGAGGGGVAVVAREPRGLEVVGARGGRHALVALAVRVGGRRRARLGLGLVLAFVRVGDAAVVERRRVVQRPQLLVERAGQRRHEVSRSCEAKRTIRASRARGAS